jgi:hypothetical protein
VVVWGVFRRLGTRKHVVSHPESRYESSIEGTCRRAAPVCRRAMPLRHRGVAARVHADGARPSSIPWPPRRSPFHPDAQLPARLPRRPHRTWGRLVVGGRNHVAALHHQHPRSRMRVTLRSQPRVRDGFNSLGPTMLHHIDRKIDTRRSPEQAQPRRSHDTPAEVL